MSSSATPISPARFSAALPSLPLPNLHLKAAELRNSIAHLEYSNMQLQPFVQEGDRDCKEAVEENQETIARMKGRIELLKTEVEGRGFVWGDEGGKDRREKDVGKDQDTRSDGDMEVPEVEQRVSANNARNGENGGRLGDEELARRLRERMAEGGMDDDDDGLYL